MTWECLAYVGLRERAVPRRRRAPRRAPWLLALVVGFALSACAPGRALHGVPPPPPTPARFAVGRDTFAFPNLVRSHDPSRYISFANYCIVMARAATQFFRFARFAPLAASVSAAEYTRLARDVMSISPWEPPRPADRRVVIPGYRDLYTFSRSQEVAIKAAFGSNFMSMLHWRTWRVAFDLSPRHQSAVAAKLVEEVRAGRPVPLMITNYPHPDLLNHVVLVYDYRVGARVVEFVAYDPNDPNAPLSLHFEPDTRSFWVGPLPYSPPGRIRAFRLFTSALL